MISAINFDTEERTTVEVFNFNLVDCHLAAREVGPEEPMLRDGDESDGGGCSAGRGVVPGGVTTTQMTMMDRTANTAAPATIDMLPAALFVTRSGCKFNSTEMLGTQQQR